MRIGGLLLTTAATKLVTDPHEYICVEQGSPPNERGVDADPCCAR
jgi:hypothetical protein